jgi:hypothetical protein
MKALINAYSLSVEAIIKENTLSQRIDLFIGSLLIVGSTETPLSN